MKTKWLDRTAVRLPRLCLVLSQKEFNAALKHLKIKDPCDWLSGSSNAEVHTYENVEGVGIACIVCLSDKHRGDPISTAATLVHEATHIKQRMMDSIGEAIPSREFEAYAIQNISLYLFEEYARRLIEA